MEKTFDHFRNKWDEKFLKMTSHVAGWSKDRSTQVGAIIVSQDNTILSIGYNGFPRNCDDNKEERHQRPQKYKYTEHAERNAIYNAAREGIQLKEAKLYGSFFPCVPCCRALIQVGIKEVITFKPDFNNDRWGRDFATSLELFEEANINVIYYKKDI